MMRFDSARQSRRVAFSYCLAFVFIVWLSATASAAPQITNISLRGLRSAATTTLTIDGADLLPEPKILLAIPISAQSLCLISQAGPAPRAGQCNQRLTHCLRLAAARPGQDSKGVLRIVV